MKTTLNKSFAVSLVIVFMLTLLIGCASKDNSDSNTQTNKDNANTAKVEPKATAEVKNTGWKADLVLGAGALGGNYYNTGAAIGDMLSKQLDKIERISVMSGGNTSFIPMLNAGKADIILGTPDTFYYAWSEEEGQGFKAGQRMEKLRMMAAFYVNVMDVIVPANSTIKEVKDIGEGKVAVIDVSLKVPMEIYLQSHGIVKTNVVVIADWNQMAQALRDKSLTAIQAISAQPIPAVVELSSNVDVRLLQSHDEDAIKNFLANPITRFFQKVTQPAGTYAWQKEDYQTVGRGSTVGVSADLSDEQVYEMTKAIYEKTDELAKIVPVAGNFKLEIMQQYLDAGVIKIPFHPGARKYFEEKGLKIPDSVPLK